MSLCRRPTVRLRKDPGTAELDKYMENFLSGRGCVVKKAVVWVLAAAMALGISALAVGKVDEERSAPVGLVVKPYAEVGMSGSELSLVLEMPRADGPSFESKPVRFTVVTNDNVRVSITESFSTELAKHFGFSESELRNLLNPRIKLAQGTDTRAQLPREYQLPGPIKANDLNAGRGWYEITVLLDWTKDSEWWRIIPTDREMGRVYFTVESQ